MINILCFIYSIRLGITCNKITYSGYKNKVNAFNDTHIKTKSITVNIFFLNRDYLQDNSVTIHFELKIDILQIGVLN